MNQKNLNYEIETVYDVREQLDSVLAMNQKNLNYEIETWLMMRCVLRRGFYESKESQL